MAEFKVRDPRVDVQVLHRYRSRYNLRNGRDLARFLADPRREDYEEHCESLSRLEAERGYHQVR